MALEANLVVLGEVGVGKSMLIDRFIHDRVPLKTEHDPTIEDEYLKSMVIDKTALRLHILDTPGISNWLEYDFISKFRDRMRSCDVVVLVISLTDPVSLHRLHVKFNEVIDIMGYKPICVVISTHSDISPRAVSDEEIKAFVSDKGPYFDVRPLDPSDNKYALAFDQAVRLMFYDETWQLKQQMLQDKKDGKKKKKPKKASLTQGQQEALAVALGEEPPPSCQCMCLSCSCFNNGCAKCKRGRCVVL